MSTGTPWPSKCSKPKLHCAGASPACAASFKPEHGGGAVVNLDARLGHAPIVNHAQLLLRRGITSVCLRLHHSTDGTEFFDS